MSTIRPKFGSYFWSCSLVWTSVSKRYRDLPDRYQKQVCEAVDPALVGLPKPLAYHCEIAMLSPLYNHQFGKWSTELTELSPFPLSYVWCTKYASCCFASDCNNLWGLCKCHYTKV